MHGCGHDGHRRCCSRRHATCSETRNFDGVAYLIFQPGEEGHAGAKAMIDDGLFERFPAGRVFALRNWPGAPAGRIGITPGPAMAAADRIEITDRRSRRPRRASAHRRRSGAGRGPHHHRQCNRSSAATSSPLDTAVISLCAMAAQAIPAR